MSDITDPTSPLEIVPQKDPKTPTTPGGLFSDEGSVDGLTDGNDPIFTQDTDTHLVTLTWPKDGPDHVMLSPESLEGIVQKVNDLTRIINAQHQILTNYQVGMRTPGHARTELANLRVLGGFDA